MNKISKIAKGLDTFCKIIYRIWIIGTVIGVFGLLLGLYLATGGWNIFEPVGANMLKELHLGMVTFLLSPDYPITEGIGQTYVIVSLIVGLLSVPVFCLTIRFIRNILKPLIDKEPFHETLAVNLKRLSFLVLAGGILQEAFEFINYSFITQNIDLKALFINEDIISIMINYRFDVDFIVFAIVLYMLSHVFKYGQELQQLSDETL